MVRQVKDPEVGRTPSGPSTSQSSSPSPPRHALHVKKDSQTNTLRIVPATPPQYLETRDPIYGRTALPTSIHHLLPPGGGKDEDVQGPALESEVSQTPVPTTSSGSAPSFETPHQPQPSRHATGSPIARPGSKKKLQVNLNPDAKTFNLSLATTSRSIDHDGTTTSESPTPAHSLSTKSSEEEILPPDTGVLSNSTASCIPETFASSSAASAAHQESSPSSPSISVDPISSTSPWNYRLVGGLRKVPKTPNLKRQTVDTSDTAPLPPLPQTSDDPPAQLSAHDLSSKPSFATTESDNTNYKVYRHSPSPSQAAGAPPSSGDSNYQILGESSPAPSLEPSPEPSPSHQPVADPPSSSSSNYQLLGDSSPVQSLEPSPAQSLEPSPAPSVIYRPQTPESNENYVLHGDPSPSASYATPGPQAEYSQESLVVPPLRPRAGKSNERFGYYKSRSRESLRTGSLTSISTVLSQKEASRAIAGTGSLVNLPGRTSSSGSGSWASSSGHQQQQHMNEHPHQWSSQLSTIGSVSEEGTDRNSRSWSEGGNGRQSSGFHSTNSRHSRQIMSISSSLAQEEERLSRSRSDSLELPQPTFARSGPRSNSSPSIRLVEGQDEYGDGITDMQELRTRPSRSRLSGFFSITSSDNGRTNTMKSSTSSRANSLVASSLPTWAKIYYGSGERKLLMAPGGSISSGDTDSRSNSFRSGSPSDHFPLSIYSPRRRPREETRRAGQASRPSSVDIRPIDPPYVRRQPFRTSSVWSPHLRTDLRTRHSVWDAPSINFSTESGLFGKRNSQVVLFIVGFIFPFAWMVAAFLPLPPEPVLSMQERDHSSTHLDAQNDFALRFGPVDEKRYESARWWRQLNRCMSFVGVIIIALIIVLAVVGVKENW